MNIKRSIVLPVLVIAVAALFATLLVGSMAMYASSRKDAVLEASLEVTRRTSSVATGITAAETYAQDVIAMTRLIPQEEVASQFQAYLRDINRDLGALLALPLPEPLRAEAEALNDALAEWCAMAVVLLGIKPAQDIPTLSALIMSSEAVTKQASMVSSLAAVYAGQAVEAANQTLSRIFVLGLSGTALIMAAALIFAMRKAHGISAAMQSAASKLRRLASQEQDGAAQDGSEIAAVFAALDTLEASLKEKKRIAERLQQEKTRAEAATETKSRFLATMSHEIRTPINGVLGMAEVLSESGLTAEQQACTGTILASSEALLRIVNDILDFSKLEAGKAQMLEQPFNLRDVIYDVATLMSPSATAKGVEICIDIPEGTPAVYTGDSGRVRQVLMNLVGNAVKFTLQGHVSITLNYDASHKIPLCIDVRDTGVGIPEDSIGQIFHAFEQVESSTARRFEGTGLGLAISSRLAEAMGGRIDAVSEPGKGSCFTICLTLPVAAPAPPATRPLAGKRVAVMADLAFSRAVRQRQLAYWGADTAYVSTPAQLLEQLEAMAAVGGQPDLVLIEDSLPPQQASDLCRCIHSLTSCRRLPIVFCAGSQVITRYQGLKDCETVHVLMKPARNKVLLRTLQEALNASAEPQTAAPAAALPGAEQAEPELSHVRLLVAEDNRTNQLVLKKMLAPSGIQITFCSNGQEAVEAFSAQPFDLVLMDMSMPVMDGLEATRQLRIREQETGCPPCPILALTANVLSTDEAACRAAGMVGFLSKPVRKQQLLEQIAKWTGSVPAPSTGAQARQA
ncbi:response regulator, sensor histidine kinase component GacS [Leisingera sp. ANG-M1]|uniref:hybrid sensor histidine kinase/response regulator n=1 Tax=Leisingera sp. ANG-M1 TaxID=1577895 RepID=UPI0005801DEB|nr:response regulator [Leisingera sp. ANG-M1]KIC10774.1 response regulator, sensor histidine kinase component GacS [Leisingera sp. ANG-M1]